MSTNILDALEQLVTQIEEDQLFKDANFKQQTIDFVRSLNRFDEEYYNQLNNLVDQKAYLKDEQLTFLTSFVLVKALKINNSRVRINAIKLLESLGVLARDTVPTLVELMIDEKDHRLLRVAIAQTLAEIGLNTYQEADDLLQFVSDPHSEVQRNVVVAISTLQEKAIPAIPVLKEVVLSKDIPPDQTVVLAILSCFGEIGSAAAQITPVISTFLKSSYDDETRSAAALSLFQIGEIPGMAIPHLIAGLNDSNKNDLRNAFVNALATTNIEKDRIAGELSAFLDDDDIKLTVFDALVQLNVKAGVEYLSTALMDSPDLVSKYLHKMSPDNNWLLKVDIILAGIRQKNRPAQSYSNLEFPHIFYAMLPPSQNSITDVQNAAHVEELCRLLIDKAFKDRKNDNLFKIITKIIAIGSRLEPNNLKTQIDDYQTSVGIEPEALFDLRAALGDTSALETEISELNAQLNNTLRNYLTALNNQGELTLAHTKTQFIEVLWMNRLIFGFGFTLGTVSVIFFFYYLLVDPQLVQTLLSLLGSAAGLTSTFLILFYKPQKQGQEAINNLSKSNVILGGFVFEMAHIAESLARLQAQNRLSLEEVEKGSIIIQAAYSKALRELQTINKDLIES